VRRSGLLIAIVGQTRWIVTTRAVDIPAALIRRLVESCVVGYRNPVHCRTTTNKSAFSFLRRLSTWHCSRLLSIAVLRRRCGRAPGRAAIDRYFVPAGPTAANPQPRRPNDATDRETDGQTDRQTDARPFRRPCCVIYHIISEIYSAPITKKTWTTGALQKSAKC